MAHLDNTPLESPPFQLGNKPNMDMSIDFNALHNVWRAATGELIISEASMDLKLPIVKRCRNFDEASEYCKNNK